MFVLLTAYILHFKELVMKRVLVPAFFIALGLLVTAIPGAAQTNTKTAKTNDNWDQYAGYTLPVFVASTRQPATDHISERGEMWFAELRVTRNARPRSFWGRGPLRENITPDLDELFAQNDSGNFSKLITENAMKVELRKAIGNSREKILFLYVHGYNNDFSEGTLRAAELAEMVRVDGAVVHFSWPSKGAVTGYLYDRESALFARRALGQLIKMLTGLKRTGGVKKVVIVSHSMGTFLTMETLSDLALSGNRNTLGRIDALVLASADIDVDVFSEQVGLLDRSGYNGDLLNRTIVFVARGDRVLAASDIARTNAPGGRVGSVEDVQAAFCHLPVNVIDINSQSALGLGAGLLNKRHSTFTNTTLVRNLLRRFARNPRQVLKEEFVTASGRRARFWALHSRGQNPDPNKGQLKHDTDEIHCQL